MSSRIAGHWNRAAAAFASQWTFVMRSDQRQRTDATRKRATRRSTESIARWSQADTEQRRSRSRREIAVRELGEHSRDAPSRRSDAELYIKVGGSASRRNAGTTASECAYAARIFAMKRSSSSRSRVLSADSVRAEVQHLFRRRAGFGGAAVDLHDAGGGLLGALRDVLHAAGDLLRRRALLLDGGWRWWRRSPRSGRWCRRSP